MYVLSNGTLSTLIHGTVVRSIILAVKGENQKPCDHVEVIEGY